MTIAKVDRACPRWQRIRASIGLTADNIDPDLHADGVWLVTRNQTRRRRLTSPEARQHRQTGRSIT